MLTIVRSPHAQHPVLLGVVTAVMLGGSALGQTQSKAAGVTPIQTINHLQIRVTDLKKSQEFYTKLFGATVIDTSSKVWSLMFPDTGIWLSLATIEGVNPATGQPWKPAALDHWGIGIDLPSKADGVRNSLKAALPDSNVMSPGKPGDVSYDRSIFLDDPDGLRIQLVSTRDDGRLPNADRVPAVARTKTQGVVRLRTINHMMVTVTDVPKTQQFYSTLIGATIRDKSANGRAMTLTLGAAKAWLSVTTVPDRSKAGLLDHLGIGIDLTPANAESVRAALRKAFPDVKVWSPGTPTASTYNRSVYLNDPDGLSIQLISSEDDGNLPSGVMSNTK